MTGDALRTGTCTVARAGRLEDDLPAFCVGDEVKRCCCGSGVGMRAVGFD
jgi:hypothetical protein